jgi:cytochrome c biogenesis protein ResB
MSMKLAVALIAILAIGSALATAIPQGLEAKEYTSLYGRPLGEFVAHSGLSRFFGSALFIAPAFLFLANLSACSVDRLVREARKKGRRRHGPDILHLGLMLLVVGSILSYAGRQEYAVSLAAGDIAMLPDGRTLRLDDSRYLAYEDGRPRDWISTISVFDEGKAQIEGYPLRVNHPLRLGKLTVYQAAYSTEDGVERSGLRAVADPGYALVLAALLIIGAGMSFILYQKLGDLTR